jgi:hypothetical protein
MKHYLPAVLALVAFVAYGVAEGLWTNRWFSSAALAEATARLQNVPAVIGDWEGTDREIDPRQVAQAEMTGYVNRRYVNRKTGAEVSVLLVCGKPGPTSLHSPEVCYPGAGFNPTGERAKQPVDGKAGDFWVSQFQKTTPSPETLRIFWAWNGAGAWHAAETPRVQFGHHAALYKLYVIRGLFRGDEPVADDPALEFLREFLPVVHEALFGASSAS